MDDGHVPLHCRYEHRRETMENNSSVWILTGGFEVQGLHYQRVGPLRKTETRCQTQQHTKQHPAPVGKTLWVEMEHFQDNDT